MAREPESRATFLLKNIIGVVSLVALAFGNSRSYSMAVMLDLIPAVSFNSRGTLVGTLWSSDYGHCNLIRFVLAYFQLLRSVGVLDRTGCIRKLRHWHVLEQ